MERTLERLGRACAARPWHAIAAWLLVAVALVGLGQLTGGSFVNDFRVPGAESQRAADLIQRHLPAYGADSAEIVWHAADGDLHEADRAAAITAAIGAIRQQPSVVDAGNPLPDAVDPTSGGLLSPDGRTATSTVRYDRHAGELGPTAYQRLDAAVEPARAAGIDVDFRGLVVDVAFEPTTGSAELVGLTAAAVVLLVSFGSVVAAGLPILVALVGLAAGTALVLIAAAAVDIPSSAPIVAVMLGLGAGIDYALFVVTRFRAALADGTTDPVTAAGRAAGTAGHAVLFAGGTVVVAILGLLFTGIPFVGAMGLAGALTVTATMAAALTLLPAVLGLLGGRVDAGRLGRRPRDPVAGSRWPRWGRHVERHRLAYAVGATLLLFVVTAPVLTLRLGTPDDGNQPAHWPQRQAYDRVAAAFGPGWNGPLVLAVPVPAALSATEAADAADGLARRLAADPAVELVTPAQLSADGRVALLTVVPRYAPQDERVADLVHRVRSDVGPAALDGYGTEVLIAGTTAFMIDIADAVADRLPWVVLAVILAAGLLLVAMFRAPLIAVKAAVLALLSIGTAYGVLVVVFQWGWGLGLIGVDRPVPIMSVVPMLLFAVLFGLSMDYEVFLLSAVREEYRRSGDAGAAVVAGLAGTGRVITAASMIMAVVFLSFVWIDDTLVKMVGIGLATAVVIDATVIRVVLAPAVLSLLGHRAWWPGRRAG
ncbi:RND superfamily putative drug exporter [Micromonospora sp. Llam0]|uniref:MMPL family transporter n=1 Tax=Micromonospora sp. Llam0 TaxID=2485143 RepID=UPI000F47BCE6|nr:MMPL family transporter [Micromonospora sp. Llam0]ROO52360.1 RND superfamily putative drug exporter [Micromonospora sp. Llam0]